MTTPPKAFVCVVEDDTATNELMAFLLRQNGYHPIQNFDGKLDWNSLKATPPDVFIIDLDLPEVGGATLIDSIRKNSALKDIPIVIISASKRVDEIAKEHDVKDFLCKPFDVEDFKRLLKNI